jgi:hypothetical protein
MFGLGILIFISALIVADAIMFVNGYRGYFHFAKTKMEKRVRMAKMRDLVIKLKEKPKDCSCGICLTDEEAQYCIGLEKMEKEKG